MGNDKTQAPKGLDSIKKVRFSLGAKFITITTIILVLSLGSVTALVSWLIHRDLRILAEENNFEVNRRSSLEAEYILQTMQANSMMLIRSVDAAGAQAPITRINQDFFFEQNPSIAAIFFAAAGQEKTSLVNDSFFNSRRISPSLADSFSQRHDEAIMRAAMGETLLINATPWFTVPVLALYFPFQAKGSAVLFSTENLNDIFGFGANQSYLINDMGDILVHTDFELVQSATNVADRSFTRFIWDNPARNLQTLFTDEEGRRFLGAFTKLNTGGSTVITSIEYDRIFEGIGATIRRNIYLAAAVLSISILIVWFFSKKISVPLKAMASAINNIENGNFKENKNFRKELRPRGSDEVGVLLANFNRMSTALEKFNQLSNKETTNTEQPVVEVEEEPVVKAEPVAQAKPAVKAEPAVQPKSGIEALRLWQKERSIKSEIKKPDTTKQTAPSEIKKTDKPEKVPAKPAVNEVKKPGLTERTAQSQTKKPDTAKKVTGEIEKPAIKQTKTIVLNDVKMFDKTKPAQVKLAEQTKFTVLSNVKKPEKPEPVQAKPATQTKFTALSSLKKPDKPESSQTKPAVLSGIKKLDKPEGQVKLAPQAKPAGKIEHKVESKQATIFVSSIHEFAAKTEAFSREHGEEAANRIVECLNNYFSHMGKCIEKTNGIVDKFIGDALMAHWGIGNAEANPAKDAFNCITTALMMRKALFKINENRKPGTPPIRIGCGINSGIVTAGQIGTGSKKEYTIIGDTVNNTSKIKALTKSLNVDILIGEETWKMVKNYFITEEMPPITTGGDKTMRIFAIVNFSGVNKGPQTLAEVRELLNNQLPVKAKVNV